MRERESFEYEEVIEKTQEYFGGDELAASAVANKYLLKNLLVLQNRHQ